MHGRLVVCVCDNNDDGCNNDNQMAAEKYMIFRTDTTGLWVRVRWRRKGWSGIRQTSQFERMGGVSLCRSTYQDSDHGKYA